MREVHVTVPASQRVELLSWTRTTRGLDVRVHHFRNLRPARGGPEIEDLMIGFYCQGSLDETMRQAALVASNMVRENLVVQRVKVECPATEYPTSDEVGYYESHMRLVGVPWFEHSPSDLTRVVLLSRSVASGEWHGTARSEGCPLDGHQDRVGKAARLLLSHRVQITGRLRHEYVEYDSRREHDAAWEGRRFAVKESADGPQA